MILYPNAKINLGLRVLNKREDGFHDIETIMIPIPVYDILEFTESHSLEWVSSGLPIPNEGKSLVLKAYELLNSKFKMGPLRIHLRKQIPIGAGLGGGSSDAAFTLLGLNEWFHLGITKDELRTLASELGSDCAFFIENTPALATGRGEKLASLNMDLSRFHVVLCNPGIHISTAIAYSSIVPNPVSMNVSKDILEKETVWHKHFLNDFERIMSEKHPLIGAGIMQLKQNGAFYAAMSGSGSSYFGLFYNPPSRAFDFTIFQGNCTLMH